MSQEVEWNIEEFSSSDSEKENEEPAKKSRRTSVWEPLNEFERLDEAQNFLK